MVGIPEHCPKALPGHGPKALFEAIIDLFRAMLDRTPPLVKRMLLTMLLTVLLVINVAWGPIMVDP